MRRDEFSETHLRLSLLVWSTKKSPLAHQLVASFENGFSRAEKEVPIKTPPWGGWSIAFTYMQLQVLASTTALMNS